MIDVGTDLDGLVKVIFISILQWKVPFATPLFYTMLWEEVTIHHSHLRDGRHASPPLKGKIYIFEILLHGRFVPFIYFFHH
jgi:hypothetical protein